MKTPRMACEELDRLMSGGPADSKRITKAELDALIRANGNSDLRYSRAWHEDSPFEVLVIKHPEGVHEILHCERETAR
jgi:hypothetical protein